jgi:phosphotransferase family enzyme
VASHALIWTQRPWRDDAEQWICERLAQLGYSLDGAIEHPHVRAWGTALRVPTREGTLWFKASIPPLAYEAALIELVGALRPDCVPRLVAADAVSGWMLMEDAGAHASDLYPDGPPVEAWQSFLGRYAGLQVDVAPAASTLVAAGVPDRRLSNLLEPFQAVLENDRLVRPATEEALAGAEIDRMRSLIPRLIEATELIAALDLPDSVQHDDLHAWNICIQDGVQRFIDWGDACISQPFLSLAIPLADVEPDDAAAIRDAYLEPWTAFRPLDDLRAVSDAAVLLGHVTGVVKWALINSALTDEERAGYEDVIPKRLRYMLSLACG